MIENTDYTINNDASSGGQTIRTIDLLAPVLNEDQIFLRQGFTQIP